MTLSLPTIDDVRQAEKRIRPHVSPAPLIRSYELEKELRLGPNRQVWIKDYGWTPVGSFKLYGAPQLDGLPSRGNWWPPGCRPFVRQLCFGDFLCRDAVRQAGHHRDAGNRAQVKFERTRSFGAEIRTYDITTDHQTGIRDRITPRDRRTGTGNKSLAL